MADHSISESKTEYYLSDHERTSMLKTRRGLSQGRSRQNRTPLGHPLETLMPAIPERGISQGGFKGERAQALARP
jgi:hypothetical protein